MSAAPRGPSRARRRSIQAEPAVGTWVRVRLYGAATVLSVLMLGILYKAYTVQVVQAAHYRELARRQHLHTVEVPAPRGDIYDATGKELAVTADVDSVYASPREVVDVVGTAERLASILQLDVRDVEAKLSSQRYFVWIKRHVTVDEAEELRAAALPGVEVTREPRRYYPAQGLAGPVLGFADIDGVGLDGLELALDDLLAGKRARLAALRDGRGRAVLSAGADDALVARAGATIDLTIDRNIQLITERALAAAIDEHEARAGTVVVLDVRNGDVLAMASWPTYDPNAPATRVGEGARNRAVTDAFEAGSIMKVFLIAAALDAGVVRPDTVIDVEHGRWKVGRKVIRDTYHDWELTTGGILKRSSNVGAVKIAFKLGAERLHGYLRAFGFGQRLGIELPGERAGVIHPWEQWKEIDLATVSYGYHMQVTALQVAAALAAIGNGGVLHEPRLVRRARSADGALLFERRPEGRRVIQESTATAMLPMLASVFEKGKHGGTARTLEVPGFRAGGKTGTARLAAGGSGYDKRYLSSFIGLAPIDQPRLAIVVFVLEPTGEHYYGGKVAGPVFATIASEALRYLGVAPTEVSETPVKSPTGVSETPVTVEIVEEQTAPMVDAVDRPREPGPGEVAVPDFTGLGVGRALDVARRAGVRVEVVGSGRAVAQEPPPGVHADTTVCRIVFARERSGPVAAGRD